MSAIAEFIEGEVTNGLGFGFPNRRPPIEDPLGLQEALAWMEIRNILAGLSPEDKDFYLRFPSIFNRSPLMQW